MTPAEHLAEAEADLTRASNITQDPTNSGTMAALLYSIANSLIAIAVELGAPHGPSPAGGDQGAETPPAG